MSVINVAKLPEPEFVAQIPAEVILTSYIDELRNHDADLAGSLRVGDPIYNTFLTLACRESIWRKAKDDADKSKFLAYAKGAVLDHIGVTYHRVERLLDEDDDAYLERIILGADGASVAGPENAYIYHARTASVDVADASFLSPAPLEVLITVLAKYGMPSDGLLNKVRAALDVKNVVPGGDIVTVQAVSFIDYTVDAVLFFDGGPDSSLVLHAVNTALNTYCLSQLALGSSVDISGVYAALRQPGVRKAVLNDWVDHDTDKTQAPRCTDITLAVGVV